MARYTGPKDRLSRREGFDLFGKGSKLTRLNIPPGVHGAKRVAPASQYGKQLREKQKVRRMYGVMEKQFRNYVTQAMKERGNTGDKLLSLLERRLDNAVYRLGFAPTRPASRQYVSHGHILVNGKKLNIPSYQVKANDSISLAKNALNIPAVKKQTELKDVKIPSWLKRKATVGMIDRLPSMEDIVEPISVSDIVEFYSR